MKTLYIEKGTRPKNIPVQKQLVQKQSCSEVPPSIADLVTTPVE